MRKDRIQAIVGCILIGISVLAVAALFLIPKNTWEKLRKATGLQRGSAERHVIAEGYQGWVTAKYGVTDKPALQKEDGMLVFRYPDSGVLETSSEWNPGIKRKEYYFHSQPELVMIARRGPNRRIWGERDIVIRDEAGKANVDRRSGFFVGTSKEYRQAERLAPHLTPELAELMTDTVEEADRSPVNE